MSDRRVKFSGPGPSSAQENFDDLLSAKPQLSVAEYPRPKTPRGRGRGRGRGRAEPSGASTSTWAGESDDEDVAPVMKTNISKGEQMILDQLNSMKEMTKKTHNTLKALAPQVVHTSTAGPQKILHSAEYDMFRDCVTKRK